MKHIRKILFFMILTLTICGCEQKTEIIEDTIITTRRIILDYTSANSLLKDIKDKKEIKNKNIKIKIYEKEDDGLLITNNGIKIKHNYNKKINQKDTIIATIKTDPEKINDTWVLEAEIITIYSSNENKEETIPTISKEENEPKEEIQQEGTTIKINLNDYINKNYLEVMESLKEKGFTNFTIEEAETTDKNKTDGNTKEISINNIKETEKNTEFKKNDKVKIIYWKKKETSAEALIKPPKGSKLEKDYESESKNDIYYINTDGIKNIPTIKKWGKATITDGVYEYFEYLEKHGFKIKITKNESREPYSGFWYYESGFTATKDEKTWNLYCDIQDEKYVEYEFRIEKNKTGQ